MNAIKILSTLAAIATLTIAATAPAEAGRRTGNWRYSPEEIYSYQQAQREAAWREHRRHRWQEQSYGYQRPGYGYGRPAYGYRQNWGGPRGGGWSDED